METATEDDAEQWSGRDGESSIHFREVFHADVAQHEEGYEQFWGCEKKEAGELYGLRERRIDWYIKLALLLILDDIFAEPVLRNGLAGEWGHTWVVPD